MNHTSLLNTGNQARIGHHTHYFLTCYKTLPPRRSSVVPRELIPFSRNTNVMSCIGTQARTVFHCGRRSHSRRIVLRRNHPGNKTQTEHQSRRSATSGQWAKMAKLHETPAGVPVFGPCRASHRSRGATRRGSPGAARGFRPWTGVGPFLRSCGVTVGSSADVSPGSAGVSPACSSKRAGIPSADQPARRRRSHHARTTTSIRPAF